MLPLECSSALVYGESASVAAAVLFVWAGHIRFYYPRSMMLPSKVRLVVVSSGISSLMLPSAVHQVVVP